MMEGLAFQADKALLDAVFDGVVALDMKTLRISLANKAAANILGFDSPDEMVGLDPLKHIPQEDRDNTSNMLASLVSGGRLQDGVEVKVLDKRGKEVWIVTRCVKLASNGSSVLLASFRDVTAQKTAGTALREIERKATQESLDRSEEKYRALAEQSIQGIVIAQGAGMQVVYCNKTMADMLGYTVDEMLSMNGEQVRQIIHPDDRDEFFKRYADRAFRLPLDASCLCRAIRKDGSVLWLNYFAGRIEYQGKRAVQAAFVDVTARKQAEEALKTSEEKYRALYEDNPSMYFTVDPKGTVLSVNHFGCEQLGYTAEELLGQSVLGVFHEEDKTAAAQSVARCVEDPGQVFHWELRKLHKSGRVMWVKETAHAALGNDGKIVVFIVCEDISERKAAEDALRDSENRYRLLAENVSDVIWSLNLKSKRSFSSPSITRLLGYTVEEAESLKMREVVSPSSYAKAMMAFSQMMVNDAIEMGTSSLSAQLEMELIRKDGSPVWVDMSITFLRDQNGQLMEAFGVIRDVTQRKRAEEALRASEEYFRALIENARDAVAIVNASGTLLYESPSSVRILGYEPEEIVGRNLAEFIRPEDVAALEQVFLKFRNEPGAIVMVDAGFRHKDGHYVECEGTLQNMLHNSKINGIVANYRDVTDRRRAEEAIRTSEERFRNLVEASSDWVWEVDPNGIYTYVSPKVREVMGYEVGEIIGKSIFDLMSVREGSHFSKIFHAHAAERRSFSFVEISRLHKDGRVLTMETSGVPFFSEDGTLLGYRGIGRDISLRKKVEKDLESSLKKVEKTMEAAIQAISYTMETRDPYTTGHQKRVTQLACAIAKEMGIAPWQIDGIRVAGLLHDIGKIAVPTEILSKPGKLSDIEFSMIKSHPKVGFDILKNVEFEWPIARIVVQHHERLDGTGYPSGIRGKEILQEARILAVADVVEAMSSHRPYRAALGIDKALAELVRGNGTLYDPDVVRACTVVINERGFKFQG